MVRHSGYFNILYYGTIVVYLYLYCTLVRLLLCDENIESNLYRLQAASERTEVGPQVQRIEFVAINPEI